MHLISDETSTLSGGGNLIFVHRNGNGAKAVHVVSRRAVRGIGDHSRMRSDMQPTGSILAISGKYIVYTSYGVVNCFRGR